jgi:hypothetical protein
VSLPEQFAVSNVKEFQQSDSGDEPVVPLEQESSSLGEGGRVRWPSDARTPAGTETTPPPVRV